MTGKIERLSKFKNAFELLKNASTAKEHFNAIEKILSEFNNWTYHQDKEVIVMTSLKALLDNLTYFSLLKIEGNQEDSLSNLTWTISEQMNSLYSFCNPD